MIPLWFLYLQGFGMLLMGVSLLVMRPRQKHESHFDRWANIGTLWALVCVAAGVILLGIALGYLDWLPAPSHPVPRRR